VRRWRIPGSDRDVRLKKTYSSREVASLTGLSARQLQIWDVGHLLSWRWWRGARGEALYDGLERLPLAHAFELHLSGCEIAGERFVDAHHGRLLGEQLVLAERLMGVCPNLRAVTFEDPRIEDGGEMEVGSRESFERLRRVTSGWAGEVAPTPHPDPLPAPRGEGDKRRETVAGCPRPAPARRGSG